MVCAREAQPEEEGWWKKLVGGGGGGYVQFSCPSRRDRVPRVPGPRVLLRRRSRRDASPR